MFGLFERSDPSDLINAFAGISDADWLDVLLSSIRTQSVRGVRLPGFPRDEVQRQFVGSAGAHSLREGFRFFTVVKAYAESCGAPLATSTRVLDFGCGWGRMLRCFLRDVAATNLHGVDVDASMVELCRSLFGPLGRFDVVPARPPAATLTGPYDLIYAYSVFSHLNEEYHLAWVEELARVLRPGGLLLATTQGRGFIDFCASLRMKDSFDSVWHQSLAGCFTDRAAALADYDAGRFLHVATGGGDYRPPSFYGESVVPQAYVERHWPSTLRLLQFRDEPSLLPQALIVTQRVPSG
jgi:SAM-dependent methyltransferase